MMRNNRLLLVSQLDGLYSRDSVKQDGMVMEGNEGKWNWSSQQL